MSIKLRPYQEKAAALLNPEGINVLSICAGGGKTFTAIHYLLDKFKNKKVLILTHGTNVLKSLWIKELNDLKIPFGTDINSNVHNIVVTLPHSLRGKTCSKVDLLIVDEAHEFYYADMVKKIVRDSSPTCQLLLTGTPSKFIAKDLNPVIVSGVEVYRDGFLSDTYTALVKSSYKISSEDYNEEHDVKGSVKMSKKDTLSSLDAVVDEMLKRLNTSKPIKDKPNVIGVARALKVSKYQDAFSKLGKTMIAARNALQASQLLKSLKSKGVKAVLSTDQTDRDSAMVQAFLADPTIEVLIVLRRGILGFNMPELVNVVDFTMSRNIDRIYQLYARVLRKNEINGKPVKKFFFRMCSRLNPAVDSAYLQAALCLANPDFISKYDGKNLNKMPMIVASRKRKESSGKIGKHKEGKEKDTSMNLDVLEEILSLDLMTELIFNKQSKAWKEFEFATFGSVISKLEGKRFFMPIININEENLKKMIETGKIDERIYEPN